MVRKPLSVSSAAFSEAVICAREELLSVAGLDLSTCGACCCAPTKPPTRSHSRPAQATLAASGAAVVGDGWGFDGCAGGEAACAQPASATAASTAADMERIVMRTPGS